MKFSLIHVIRQIYLSVTVFCVKTERSCWVERYLAPKMKSSYAIILVYVWLCQFVSMFIFCVSTWMCVCFCEGICATELLWIILLDTVWVWVCEVVRLLEFCVWVHSVVGFHIYEYIFGFMSIWVWENVTCLYRKTFPVKFQIIY